jgi:CHAD domain-containing protein
LRALARRQVRAALTNPDYSVQMICLTQKLHEQNWEADRSVEQRMLASQPANAFASSVLERAHRRVFRQAKRMDRSSAADIHKLRIRIKRLRYCSELLSPLFKRKAARKFLKRLAGMQDMLGAHNDAVSAANLIDQLRQANDTPEYVEVLAYLRGYAHAQSRFSLSGFGAKWNKLDSAAVFW